MTSFRAGRRAEAAAAEFLRRKGYTIISQNWKTRRCEIDIVAKRRNLMFFVEVKYRSTDKQGEGLDYITQKKIDQMYFAAEQWVADNDWRGDYRVAALAVAGKDFVVSDYVEDLF